MNGEWVRTGLDWTGQEVQKAKKEKRVSRGSEGATEWLHGSRRERASQQETRGAIPKRVHGGFEWRLDTGSNQLESASKGEKV